MTAEKTAEEIEIERARAVWWEKLPAASKRRILRHRAREKAKQDLTGVVIDLMIKRSYLQKGPDPHYSKSDWQAYEARQTADIARLDLALERIMIKKLKLDHLEYVSVYGIKQRVPRKAKVKV